MGSGNCRVAEDSVVEFGIASTGNPTKCASGSCGAKPWGSRCTFCQLSSKQLLNTHLAV